MADLVAQLRSGVDNADGGEMGGVVLTMNLAASRIEELEAANDAAEKSNRISDNGNLWRFWSDKANDLARKNAELAKALRESLGG